MLGSILYREAVVLVQAEHRKVFKITKDNDKASAAAEKVGKDREPEEGMLIPAAMEGGHSVLMKRAVQHFSAHLFVAGWSNIARHWLGIRAGRRT